MHQKLVKLAFDKTEEKLKTEFGITASFTKKSEHLEVILKDEFNEIVKLFKWNGVILDERKKNGEIVNIYNLYSGLPIRKVGKKEEFQKEMQEYLRKKKLSKGD